MKDYSYIFNAHPTFIENMYQQYKANPTAVDEGWRTFFEGFDFAVNQNGHAEEMSATATSSVDSVKEIDVRALITAFRYRGHLLSTTNPIKERRDRDAKLNLADFNLPEADLNSRFVSGKEIGLPPNSTLQEILDRLHKIYAGNIGFEFSHINDRARRRWLRRKIEDRMLKSDYGVTIKKKRRILEKLNGAVLFEQFLHKKYVGQKRFSLEGGETTIPALDAIINEAVDLGVEEVIIGMAHRGRLNVLANIMGKTYEEIFNEFEGTAVPDLSFGDGDVKYHLGIFSKLKTLTGKDVYLKMAPNPSHLEAVNTVVQGYARAKADILYKSDHDKILPILLHGDAAIAGQGIVYETVQMSKLEGYYTGGTIHFVINNQVGFTTDFDDARSATYCTAAAMVVEAPVFHVNGDDPEAVIFAAELAAEYRQEFNNDVFIDMVCYRRHGHNEGDDPKFTQPKMYDIINNHPNPRDVYLQDLLTQGDVEEALAKSIEKEFLSDLQARFDEVKQKPLPYKHQKPELAWHKMQVKITADDVKQSPKTGIAKKEVEQIIEHLLTVPDGFTPLKKFGRLLKTTQKLYDAGKMDWAMAELSAYASLLLEGNDVRMSGQDVKRGTFSHRHAVLVDSNDKSEYNRINTIEKEQGKYRIYNSLLSEFGVMGFEFGYSLATPDTLVLWEGQFGDFYNGAQVIVDQFISSSESKWLWTSGLVLLLPHGYAGQGPEHSSARFERFLQMCAEYNMSVVNITEPANFFHALRRQIHRPFRRPLIVMSPKSLLRHPRCISDIKDFTTNTRFKEIIDDPAVGTDKNKAAKVKRVLCCTGKIYYDLLAKKEADKRDDIAIVRIEQLYPMPEDQVLKLQTKYKDAEMVWVQEEPQNMGAWQYILSQCHDAKGLLRRRFTFDRVVSRKASASPATGFKKRHDEEQAKILEEAFG